MALNFLNNGYFASSVGIGTDSPSSQLSIGANALTTKKPTVAIVDGVAGGSLLIRGLSPILSFDKTSTGVPKILMDTGGLQFKTGTLDAEGDIDMVILPSGNVGIGVVNPSQAKLVVNGNVAFNQGDETMGQINTEFERLDFKVEDGVVNASPAAMTLRNYSGGPRMGIGTVDPTQKLQVNGRIYIEQQGTNWNETTPGLGIGALHFDPVGDGADNTGNAITFGASDASSGTTANAGIYTRSDGSFGTKMYFATTDSYAVGSKTRMTINSNGNVGIGTTSPGTKLDVNGIISLGGQQFAKYDSTNDLFIVGDLDAAGAQLALNVDAGEAVRINATGAIRFNTYGAGTLVSDASGNITSSSTGTMSSWILKEGNGTETSTVTNGETVTFAQGTGIQSELTSTSSGGTITITNTAPDTGVPAILNAFGTPLLNGISAAQIRSLIGAGTGSGTVTGSGSANRLAFWTTGANISSDGKFSIDATNNALYSPALIASNSRITTTKQFPVGHYTPGETVWEIDPTWNEKQLQEYFGSSNVSWDTTSIAQDAPGGYAIYINGAVNVGGVYNSGFPYIPIDNDGVYYMECYIKNVGEMGHYMGSNEFNATFASVGGNPGSYGYWVMSNTNPGTNWTKVKGYIGGFDSSQTGKFELAAKYWTPQALFNYTNGSGTRACYISGWKAVRVDAPGNRYFDDNVNIGSNALPSARLQISQTGSGASNTIITQDNARKIFIGRDSIKATDLSDNAAMLYIQQNGGNVTFGNNAAVEGTLGVTGKITASGGINGLTLANGGISGSNYNITGVNQLTISDPGEGIVFGGGAAGSITLAIIDDAADNILNLNAAAAFKVNAKITNLTNPTAAQDAATKAYVDAAITTPGNGQIDGRTSGNGLSGSMDATANQSGNTTFTVTSNATAAITSSTIAYRDSSADISARLFRSSYANQSTISGGLAFRVNNGSDNYTRFCSSPSAIRSFIGAGTSSATPAILSNGSTPSLNSGISAAEVRLLIGAGTGSGTVIKTGTPANNQIAIFTNSSTLEGVSGLTYNNTTLATTGNIGVETDKKFILSNDTDAFAFIMCDEANAFGFGDYANIFGEYDSGGQHFINGEDNAYSSLFAGQAQFEGNVILKGGTRNLIFDNTSESQAGIIFRDQQDPTGQAAAIKFDSGATGRLSIFVNDLAASAERMTFALNGFVGIGDTTPAEKLQVNGNIRANGYKSSDGSTGLTGTFSFRDNFSALRNIVFKNGLAVSTT